MRWLAARGHGADDNCDGRIDEGSLDTDCDKIADCTDPDDDNDCILDGPPDGTGPDNCNVVKNGNQYCAAADTKHGRCGDRCPIPRLQRVLGDFIKWYMMCQADRIPRECWTARCEGLKVFQDHWPRVRDLPMTLERPSGSEPDPTDVVDWSSVRLGKFPRPAPSRLCEGMTMPDIGGVDALYEACMRRIRNAPCLTDSDGDGQGDACDPPPAPGPTCVVP